MPLSDFIGGAVGGAEKGMSLYQALLDSAYQKKKREQEEAANAPVEIDQIGTVRAADAPQFRLEMMKLKKGSSGAPMGMRLKPGEVWDDATQSVKALPGSDLFIAQSGKHAQDVTGMKNVQLKTEDAKKQINELLYGQSEPGPDPKQSDAMRNLFGGGYSGKVTQWFDPAARKKLESVKANMRNIGLDMMKQGGSIGAVTEREWPMIEAAIASIDTSLDEESAAAELQKVAARLDSIKRNAQQAYETEWGNTQYYQQGQQDPMEAKRQRLMQLKAKAGM